MALGTRLVRFFTTFEHLDKLVLLNNDDVFFTVWNGFHLIDNKYKGDN